MNIQNQDEVKENKSPSRTYKVLIANSAKNILNEQKWKILEEKLKNDPEKAGYPLSSLGGRLWEARVGNYRVYYVIIRDCVEILCVWVIGYKHKNEQRKFLNNLRGKNIKNLIEKIKENAGFT